MARQKADGLRYFSFDTDFFYSDMRIKSLRSRYGCKGLLLYIFLLTEIYRNGYYITWDNESIDCCIAELGLSEGFIEIVMSYLISRSILTEVSTLANPITVVTSPGIQKRYQKAMSCLKRDVVVDKEKWLLSEEETATFIKFTQNEPISQNNNDKSEKNSDKSEKNVLKEKKLNEINNKDIVANLPEGQTATFHAFKNDSFEMNCVEMIIASCIEILPNSKVPDTDAKKYKWAADIEKMKRLDKRSEKDILKALEFAVSDSFWKPNIRSAKKFREKFETLLIQSNRKNVQTGSSPKNSFNNYQNKQDYDFNELEKELLSN